MALLQGGAYPGLDAVEGLPRRGDPVRQSKLNYGQELRAQMEADNARRQQQRAAPTPAEPPAVGILPRGRPAFADNRLPVVRGATPPAGARRPRSALRANRQPDSQSPPKNLVPGGGQPPPPRFGNEESGAGQRVLEQEVQHLTHQVQELLVGLHGRVLMLEQDLNGTRRDKEMLLERLQGLELDNVALRAEVKVLAPGERVANLERDMTQKLHAHLEHVTSVESERVVAALQRMHHMQLEAQEERRKNEASQHKLEQQQQIIGVLEERLRVVESSETHTLRQQAQEHETRQIESARMEVRVHELEAALRALSARGEQVVRDTGDAMKNLVLHSTTSVLTQLQHNVNALSTQMLAVEQQLNLRSSDMAQRTSEEGEQRMRSLAQLEKSFTAQLARMEAEVAEARDARGLLETAIREGDERVLAQARDALATTEEATATSMLRVDRANARLRSEIEEEIARATTATEEKRVFLEEVVRAEIRGRLQGQEALARRVMEVEETARGDAAREQEHNQTFTLLKLLQAKTKAHSKSMRMLGTELDAVKRAAKSSEQDLAAKISACAVGQKEGEERGGAEARLERQAAREALALVDQRLLLLEEGRGEILDKITREVDSNRLADNERARDISERIEGLQRAVDACVDMCQSDLRDLQEAQQSLEHRLDREAEGLEGLMDRTARDLTRSLDTKLQGSMKEAVQSLATELEAEIGALRAKHARSEAEAKEQRLRMETQRQALEHKIRAAQHQVEEAEGRQNVSVKRLKDELLEKTAVYSGRFDALDEQLHAARALAAQHKCESVERDTLLDGKVRRLEQELLFSGGVGQAQSALRLLDVPNPMDLLAPFSPPPASAGTRGLEDKVPLRGGAGVDEAVGGGGSKWEATKTAAGGGRGGLIGNMQEELEAFRKHVLLELQDVQQKIAESSERATDTRRQLGETEGRLGMRTDSVWEETRQQWEAVSKRLQEESRAVQEQLSVQRRVEQEHRDELDAAIRAEASARAAATAAAASELEAAVLALGKRIEGVGGVEAHLAEARAAANEAIAELRQQLADEEARRVEHGGSLEARLVTADEALRQAEERIRGLVAGKDDEAKLREDALLSALQRVKGGVEELGRRAEGMESAQRRHAEELVARHTEMTKALNAGARHTVAIADAHRRDIDRVCRESECGTVLLALVERVAAAESEERRNAEAVRAAQALEHGLKALKAEVVSALVPHAVKEQVKEEMTLQVLPLRYSVTDLMQAVHDNETQAQNFHDSVSIKLVMMEGTVESHTEELQKHAASEKAAAAELKRLDALRLAQEAALSRRLDHAETNVAEATVAAVLESMVRELEAGPSQLSAASLAATVAQLEDRFKEVGDKVMDVGDKLASMNTSTREQLRHLQTKLAETEQLTTVLAEELVSDESTEKDVEALKSQVHELVEKVKRLEGELDAVLVAGGGGVSPMASGSQDSALVHLSAASAKDSAREERKMLGGGDMDTISEEEEPPSPAPDAPVAAVAAPVAAVAAPDAATGATGAASDTRTEKGGGGSGDRKEERDDVEDAGAAAEHAQDAATHSPPPDAKIDSAPPSQAVESDKDDGGKGGVEGGGLASAPQPLAADKDASLNT